MNTRRSYPIILLLAILFQVASAQNRCEILSLNNSLIDYNNQPQIFNEMVKEQGKDAYWQARTQLGRTLLFHYNNSLSYNEAMSRPWDFIILQEQSALPRNHPEILMQSVELWRRALNNQFGTEAPILVLPMNWAYCDSTAFLEQTRQLKRSYLDVEREIPSVVVCPIGIAYEIIFNDYGPQLWERLYTDNRHPSPIASYLAACLEYAIIFNESPLTIKYFPETVTPEDAATMRKVASKALQQWNREKMASR